MAYSILKELSRRIKNLVSTNSSDSFPSRFVPNGKDMVVGLEEDLMELRGQLCGEQSKLQVIPIIGMGGIGKTTLARYAHDDTLIVQHFDIRVWVTVSQNSSTKQILFDLLNSTDASTEGLHYYTRSEELLEGRVHKWLKRRRYLIVMDDMWDTNVWDDVRRIVPDDCNGSRIIITTRLLDVASYVGSSSLLHEMRLMGVEQSWNLLRQKVFGEENCPPELEEIGKQIAKNCRGLPLAIVVIAGVLSPFNQKQDTWKTIARNVCEALNTSDKPFAEILSLSYTSLPLHLRPCFLYMGGFPEDYEIKVSRQFKLWAAEGFLKPNRSRDIEEVAEDYLEDLVRRSLILIHKKRYNGKIKTVKIHDLLRKLCLSKARDEKFLQVIHEFGGEFPDGTWNSRRLSIFSNIGGGLQNVNNSKIQTVLVFRYLAFDSLRCFRLLRVVDEMNVRFISLLNEIGELLQLRYLAVALVPPRKTLKCKFPESLSKLQNLETLIIRGRSEFTLTTYLPPGIWKMPKLRHVILFDALLPDPSTESCDQILALENLRTLKRVCRFTCSERILGLIPNLKKLGIIYSFRDIYEAEWSMYGLSNLVYLHKLEKLNFYAHPHDYFKSNLSQNLAFPVTLKKLTLSGSGIPWEGMFIVGSLPNLEVLKLKRHACHGFEWETTEGEFIQLKKLLIDSSDPHYWTTESSHFPRLERLLLYNCHSLKEIPYSIGEIPALHLIELDRCNFSIVESAKFIEEEQHSLGNDLKVHLKTSSDWNLEMEDA